MCQVHQLFLPLHQKSPRNNGGGTSPDPSNDQSSSQSKDKRKSCSWDSRLQQLSVHRCQQPLEAACQVLCRDHQGQREADTRRWRWGQNRKFKRTFQLKLGLTEESKAKLVVMAHDVDISWDHGLFANCRKHNDKQDSSTPRPPTASPSLTWERKISLISATMTYHLEEPREVVTWDSRRNTRWTRKGLP